MNPLRSKKAAIAYAYFLNSIHPHRKYYYFKVPKDTEAYKQRCIYGVCDDLEKPEYEKHVTLTEVIPLDL